MTQSSLPVLAAVSVAEANSGVLCNFLNIVMGPNNGNKPADKLALALGLQL